MLKAEVLMKIGSIRVSKHEQNEASRVMHSKRQSVKSSFAM
jgi:hypothetical protein